MSKMSQLNADLTEQAAEFGFESIEQAEEAGYGIDWDHGKLIDPQVAAHEALMVNRDNLIFCLDRYSKYTPEMCCRSDIKEMTYLMKRTARFLKENVK